MDNENRTSDHTLAILKAIREGVQDTRDSQRRMAEEHIAMRVELTGIRQSLAALYTLYGGEISRLDGHEERLLQLERRPSLRDNKEKDN